MVAFKTVGTIFALLSPLLARRDLVGAAMDKQKITLKTTGNN